MALSANTRRQYERADITTHGVLANATIYEGSAVGSSGGYARALTAADQFLGFALQKVVGTAANGGATIEVQHRGKVYLAVDSVAITDIGAAVYAADDGTFSLVSGSDSYVGIVHRFVDTGYAIVEFDAQGTGGNGLTLANVGATHSGDVSSDINANFTALLKLLK
jgi:hypothetical protein